MHDPIRILVVDDEPDILDSTARVLQKAGYAVDKASCGEEALRLLHSNRQNLVLLDRDLPDINGVEVCRRIKQDQELAETFVILISGKYTESAQQSEGLEMGADGYISRPIANRELAARVESFVRILRQTHSQRQQIEEKLGKIEEHLRQSQKIETLGLMAGGMVHYFNNLLAVISRYTDLTLQHLGDGNPLKENVLQVKSASDRATLLTRQFLDFGRKQVSQPVPLNLDAIIAGIEKMLRRIIPEDIDFLYVRAPDTGLVMADPVHMEQVIINLVLNSRDAMPDGGRLTIETANVNIGEGDMNICPNIASGHYVLLTVADTGCGMDKETKNKIFEPFFTTKENGTGLGLSTVYGIVKQSSGKIHVRSEPGKGTTFHIYLPQVVSSVTAVAESRTVMSWVKGSETILVVEHEYCIRMLIEEVLSMAGYTVLATASSSEALKIKSTQRHIDLVLTDVMMPLMSGITLAEHMTKECPGIKILYMSGYSKSEFKLHGIPDQVTHFISKPFGMSELMRKVRDVLDGPAA